MPTTYDGQVTRTTPHASSVTGDTGIGRAETPVERRLREIAASTHTVAPIECRSRSIFGDAEVIDAGREAIALLRELSVTADVPTWSAKRRALLARCEGDR